jgi:hypothetical protein
MIYHSVHFFPSFLPFKLYAFLCFACCTNSSFFFRKRISLPFCNSSVCILYCLVVFPSRSSSSLQFQFLAPSTRDFCGLVVCWITKRYLTPDPRPLGTPGKWVTMWIQMLSRYRTRKYYIIETVECSILKPATQRRLCSCSYLPQGNMLFFR